MKPLVFALVALVLAAATASAAKQRCASDSIAVGPLCVDRYEATVWQVPESKKALVNKIQRGEVTLAELRAAGAQQIGAMTEGSCVDDIHYPSTFPNDGGWTKPLYAVSVAGVLPTTCTTWFQAQQACRLSGKRLLRNEEWQAAAAGTPDSGINDNLTTTCATASAFGVPTGSRSGCKSSWGVQDMVGNAWEWVAEWGETATACGRWLPEMGDDLSCIGSGPEVMSSGWPVPRSGLYRPANYVLIEEPVPGPNTPSGLIRGGNYAIQDRSGVFAYYQSIAPTTRSRSTGFRCAR